MNRCLRRVCSWRVPPNWSALNWFEEVWAISAAATCQAESDFDPRRGVPAAAFVYQRVLASVFTRYRQEWTYARRCLPDRGPPATLDPSANEPDPLPSPWERWPPCHLCSPDALLARADLAAALGFLPHADRELILLLFWQERTESQIARALGISQPAVNKRKHAILRRLRSWWEAPPAPDRNQDEAGGGLLQGCARR